MKKVTKAQIRAYVKRDKHWFGYIVGNKVAEYHIDRGWCLGMSVELYWVDGRGVCVWGEETCEHSPTEKDPYNYALFPRTLEDLLLNWAWYNANSETGKRAAFYEKGT